MKKLVLLLALLMISSLGGCTRGEDLTDTLTTGAWRVSYYSANGDEDTRKFLGYVFTFVPDGTVTVARPALPLARGTWDDSENETRLDISFSDPGLLEKINQDWIVDRVQDDEIQLHKLYAPGTQLEFHQL